MRIIHVVIVIIITALLAFPVALWVFSPKPIDVLGLTVTVKVDEIPAFQITDEPILRIGAIPPGLSGRRGFNLTNDYDHPIRAIISYKGHQWLYLSESKLTISPNETRHILVHASIPSDAEYGDYEWHLNIALYKHE
ncbi:MAG: hypothetical protein ACMXYL_03835 [Candidatus Woesearchaeota archaeon]